MRINDFITRSRFSCPERDKPAKIYGTDGKQFSEIFEDTVVFHRWQRDVGRRGEGGVGVGVVEGSVGKNAPR